MLKKTTLITLFNLWKKGSYAVTFWDGDTRIFGDDEPLFTIIFHKEPTFTDIKNDIILTLGEAYMNGIIDFQGSMDDIINTMFKNTNQDYTKKYAINKLTQKMKLAEETRERSNIHQHYDLGNDFFSLWLDPTLSYSCAYFKTDNDSLELAQQQKIEHSLIKLNLQPGENLLDIGCGWGYLVIAAAQKYKVHATGITLSEEQYYGARKRVEQLGLEDLVTIKLKNYLDLDPEEERFDKIISIGMFEHVGEDYLPVYLNKVNSLLKDNSVFLLHSIMGMNDAPTNSWIKKYIFPGGYVPSLTETIEKLANFNFHIIHMESLRRHYAKTLDLWYKNFAANSNTIATNHNENFMRMWSLYLTGCAAAFRTGGIDIYQILMTKDINNKLPMTYDYMYK